MITDNLELNKVLIQKPEDVPMVSIITPTRDGRELLKKCWNAIEKNWYPNWEWIVGDSNSIDGTNEFMNSIENNKVKYIQRGTTEGSFSSINNELVKKSIGQFLLFLNNDCYIDEFCLFNMMAKIINNKDVGAVGAKLLYPGGKIQHAGIAFLKEGPANLSHAALKQFASGFANSDRFFQAVTGACLLMRREDFDLINGFDEVYHFVYDDCDLCLKINKNLNKKIVYASNATAIHNENVTQKKHKTAGILQQNGIKIFKERWMNKVEFDFYLLMRNSTKNIKKIDISFITCFNNMNQYKNHVVSSLFKNFTTLNYEIIPINNTENKYSAAQALNIGLDQSKGDIVVFCHQDIIFYQNWVNKLFERINEIEKIDKKWGVLGTAGITAEDDTIGVVHNLNGTLQWRSTKLVKTHKVQTVDEHCMIIRKNSGLRFDEKILDGFHFYGPDLCISAIDKGMNNYGILCPLIHNSSSGSLLSGKKEFYRLMNAFANKWGTKYNKIRTTTSIIRGKSCNTFVEFNE